MSFLFFSLAKHQRVYFQRLLDHGTLAGRVVEPWQLPWPRPWQLPRVLGRLNWSQLIEEKCHERRVKRKYQGRLYRMLLCVELAWVALRILALLKQEQPGAVVMWNGSHRYCQLLLALLAPETRTFFFENGLLPNTTTLDTKGVNFRNSVPRETEFYRNYAMPAETRGECGVTLVPRKPRNTGLQPISLPEGFVFIPFQDDRDTQVRLFSPWIGNMRALFALGERLVRETNYTVVFKEHPSSRESYPDLHERTHERLMFANGNSTQELIERSQFVVTLNSTVGLESLLLGKPVLTLGQAFFNIPGLVAHADSAEEFIKRAQSFPHWSLAPEVRRAFIRYLAVDYCVPGSWQNPDNTHLDSVVKRLSSSK